MMIVVFILCFNPFVFADTNLDDIVNEWLLVFRSDEAPETVLRKVVNGRWPFLSDSNVNKEGSQELAHLFHLKVVRLEREKVGSDSLSLIPLYMVLSDRLKSSKGYYNFVLAESLNRLILSNIIYALLSDSSKSVDLRSYVNSLKEQELLRSVIDASVQAQAAHEDESRGEILSAAEVFALNGRTTGEMLLEYAYKSQLFSTLTLIRDRSDISLIMRSAYSEMFINAHVSALLSFLERGGILGELTDDEFKRLMPDLQDYSYPDLGIDNFGSEHMYGIIQFSYGDIDCREKNPLSKPVFDRM